MSDPIITQAVSAKDLPIARQEYGTACLWGVGLLIDFYTTQCVDSWYGLLWMLKKWVQTNQNDTNQDDKVMCRTSC